MGRPKCAPCAPHSEMLSKKEMRQTKIINHRFINLVHTLLLFGGMFTLLAVLGLAFAGVQGLLWASGLGVLFLIFSQRIPPEFLLRMHGARPLAVQEAPGLYALMRELAHRASLPTAPKLYYIPAGFTNAITIGSRREPAIALTDGILRRLDRRELTAVLAHEISHIRHNDIQVMRVADAIGRITGMLATFGQILLLINLPLLIIGRAPISWLAILLLVAAPTLSGLLQLALSRTREFDADLGAVRITGDPEGLARALQKLEYYNQSIFRRILLPGRGNPESSLFRTHPKTSERIERLMDLTDDDRFHQAERPIGPIFGPRYLSSPPGRSRQTAFRMMV